MGEPTMFTPGTCCWWLTDVPAQVKPLHKSQNDLPLKMSHFEFLLYLSRE